MQMTIDGYCPGQLGRQKCETDCFFPLSIISMRSIDIADVALDIPSRQLIDRQVRERRVRRLTTINTSSLWLFVCVLATNEECTKEDEDEDHR